MTRLDEVIEAAKVASADLRKLSFGAYTRHQVADIVVVFGARLETFLRAALLPAARRRDTLEKLIDQLGTTGMGPDDLKHLHQLRNLYNASKHDPAAHLLLATAAEAIEDTSNALLSLARLEAGVALAPLKWELNYHLWVAFWDHYHTGDTEIAVILPSAHWPQDGTVDLFHMNAADWYNLKSILTAHPRFRLGRDHFKPDIWEGFRSEDDFLNAGIWDGDYGELAGLLARFEDREVSLALLPSVARRANPISIGTALVMATVDVARSTVVQPNEGQFQTSIIQRAEEEYALHPVEPAIRQGAAQLSRLITNIEFDFWRYLVGPVLVRRKQEEKLAFLSSGPLNLRLDGNAIVLGI